MAFDCSAIEPSRVAVATPRSQNFLSNDLGSAMRSARGNPLVRFRSRSDRTTLFFSPEGDTTPASGVSHRTSSASYSSPEGDTYLRAFCRLRRVWNLRSCQGEFAKRWSRCRGDGNRCLLAHIRRNEQRACPAAFPVVHPRYPANTSSREKARSADSGRPLQSAGLHSRDRRAKLSCLDGQECPTYITSDGSKMSP
jgi:hypothetical protein